MGGSRLPFSELFASLSTFVLNNAGLPPVKILFLSARLATGFVNRLGLFWSWFNNNWFCSCPATSRLVR